MCVRCLTSQKFSNIPFAKQKQPFPIRSSTFQHTKKLCGACGPTERPTTENDDHHRRGSIPCWPALRPDWSLPRSRPRSSMCAPARPPPQWSPPPLLQQQQYNHHRDCTRNFDPLSNARASWRCTADCDPRCGGMCRFPPFTGFRWSSVAACGRRAGTARPTAAATTTKTLCFIP